MIFLKSIRLDSFKGVENLSCTFDDLTILSGLNNAGKTTVLEAIHILIGAIPLIVEHPHLFHELSQHREIDLQKPIASLGLPSTDWLMPFNEWESDFRISAIFYNDVKLTIARGKVRTFIFEVELLNEKASDKEDESEGKRALDNKVKQFLQSLHSFRAELILPPGVVASREDMMPGPQYNSLVQQGKATQHWRNSLWWAIQDGGIEKFEPVRSLVNQYFPEIDVEIPVLGSKQSPPSILIKFNDRGRGTLDISQSGSRLRTFLTLARSLEQSDAQIVLFDEPDAHLHASQQAVVLDLLLDAAASSEKQVIIATHSPEILTRAPSECIRWVERTNSSLDESEVQTDLTVFLSRLGATSDVYLSRTDFPEIIVYVEGKKDRPFIESLIKWCLRSVEDTLPQALVIEHRDGRFDAEAVQALARLACQFHSSTRIVGVRDLDWHYDELPPTKPNKRGNNVWTLLNLPVKEFENLLCDPDVLHAASKGKISKEQLIVILEEESKSNELLNEWRFNVLPIIRKLLGQNLAENTREKQATEIFDEWTKDSTVRARLVAGKALLGKIRERVRRAYGVSCYPTRALDRMKTLTPTLAYIADAIFPNQDFLQNED